LSFLHVKKLLAFVWLGLLTACVSNETPPDSPAHGTIAVVADESFQPLVYELTGTYSGIYPDTHFKVTYQSEQQAIASLLRDQARIAFTTRKLTSAEQSVLNRSNIRGAAHKIATDGVALITGRANTDSLITMAELRGIFTRKLKTWAQLSGGNQAGPITLVFDNDGSSNLNFMLKTLGVTDMKGLRIFTAKSNRQVIDYVGQNPTALGFIGVNWISDAEGPLSAKLAGSLRVLGVSAKDKPTRDDYYQPFQKSVGLGDYPLSRPVYILSREAHAGLGGGLVNYILRDAGSLIIEKLGLWPAIPYNREVSI
jgi:phosphate transport system substrate-binding protein